MAEKEASRWNSQGRAGLPDKLSSVEGPWLEFDNARDPFRRIQREDMKKTEAQRRGETGGGSQMVKQDRPFPELKPRNDNQPARDVFNQKWRAENQNAKQRQSRLGNGPERQDPFSNNPTKSPDLGRSR